MVQKRLIVTTTQKLTSAVAAASLQGAALAELLP